MQERSSSDLKTVNNKVRNTRILVGISVPVLFALLVFYELTDGLSHVCWFYRLTGLYCPGCGSGRTVYALFHGHFTEIFTYNILLIILGIPCILILAHEYLRIVFPRLSLKPVQIPKKAQVGILVIILAFWILRNIPAFSFLAPGQ